jgi:hypothetical protein
MRKSDKRRYTEDQVRGMRGLYGGQGITFEKLSRVYGGTPDNIGKVINRVYYKEIE